MSSNSIPQPVFETSTAESDSGTGFETHSESSQTESVSICFVFILLGIRLIWENPELRLVALSILVVAITWFLIKYLVNAIYIYFKEFADNLLRALENFVDKRRHNSVIFKYLWIGMSS